MTIPLQVTISYRVEEDEDEATFRTDVFFLWLSPEGSDSDLPFFGMNCLRNSVDQQTPAATCYSTPRNHELSVFETFP